MNMLIDAYRFGSGAGPSTDYVDDFITLSDIRACYGLDKLISGYSGSAIRVRRSSDNAEQDIGFSSGVFDAAALASFVGSNSAYVRKWYDQSGSGEDKEQATSGSQPIIVNAGTFLGGFETDGIDDYLECTSFAGINDPQITVFMAAQLYTTGTSVVYPHVSVGYLGSGAANGFELYYYPGVQLWSIGSGNTSVAYHTEYNFTGFDPTGSIHTLTMVGDRAAMPGADGHKIYIDGGSDCAGTVSGNALGSSYTGVNLYIGGSPSYGRYGKGLHRSLVVCANDHTAVRADVEALL